MTPVNVGVTGMLVRNFKAALQGLHTQHVILVVLRLAGPKTGDDLFTEVQPRVPYLTRISLQRHLTIMRKCKAVKLWTFGPQCAVWSLPQAPQPPSPARRHPRAPVTVERRESWWTQPTREAFREAYDRRWAS